MNVKLADDSKMILDAKSASFEYSEVNSVESIVVIGDKHQRIITKPMETTKAIEFVRDARRSAQAEVERINYLQW